MSEELFKQTDEDELHFKRQFAIQFLASWAAIYYVEYSATLVMNKPKPPVEDAVRHAQKAWDYWCFVKP